MSEWPAMTVAELQECGVLLVEDGNHGEFRPRPSEFAPGGTAFIRAADLSDGRVCFDEAETINDVALARIRKGIGVPGDVLFSHKGSVGKVARVGLDAPPFVCSPQTTFWRVLDLYRLDPAYLYSFMRSRLFIDQWWVRKGDTDMADYVSLTAQRQLQIIVPPLSVQKRIAAPLEATDDMIENTRRRIALLEEMAQAMYREWFVHFRYPGHHGDELVESPFGPIPVTFKIQSLGDVSAINRAQRRPAPDERLVYIDISALGERRLTPPAPIIGSAAPGRARRVLSDGDIVWSMVRPGRRAHALIVRAEPNWIASTGLAVISPDGVPTSFVFESVSNRAFSDYLVQQEGGAAYPAVKPIDFAAAEIAVPPSGLLQAFDELVSPIHTLVWNLSVQKRRVAELRDLLLPKLMTGAIDVSKLDLDALLEEPAA